MMENHISPLTTKKLKKKKKSSVLEWVYPPNNWKTHFNRTFIYGFSNPQAKLFVASDEYLIPEKVKIFPNGNFAQVIKLPNVQNIIKLIQILNGKKKTISRNISIELNKQRKKQTKLSSSNKFTIQNPKSKMDSILTPKSSRLCIVIDPGHGGKEHGTHSPKGIPESTYNLQIAKLLYQRLKNQKFKLKIKVYLTRTKNKFISLKQRVAFAKRKKSNLLISIHHNALPDNLDPLRHRGIGVYYTYDNVKPLANTFLNSICKKSGLRSYGLFKRDFALTRPTFCAAILVECGFLIHPLEAEYIISKKTQAKIVQGIVNAIYFVIDESHLREK